MKKIITLCLFSILFVNCKSNNEKNEQTPPQKEEQLAQKETFAQKTAKAHHQEAFVGKEAIQYNLKISFGGKEIMDARITVLTNSTQAVIEFKNGSKIVIDKNKVDYDPSVPSEKSVRFDAYTWNYFFLFPYKLNDPGTIWTVYENKESNHDEFSTEKLTFKSGTGDAPDDWYVVYTDNKTNLVSKAAYIVTAMAKKEEAEKNPHAIQYLDYKEVDGVPIATKWLFWEWKEGEGITKEIGQGILSNIHFVKVDENTFKKGDNYKTI